MKKEAAVIRHPHYPEIIKFKIGSVKTTSTLSTSNQDEDLNNCEKLSFTGEGCFIAHDNTSCQGDNDGGTYSANKNKSCCQGSIPSENYGEPGYELEDNQPLFDEDSFNPLNLQPSRNNFLHSPCYHL